MPIVRFPRLRGRLPPFLLERAALRDALAAVYQAPEDARRLARKAGLRLSKGAVGSAAADVWHAVVSDADRKGKVSVLVRFADAECGA